MTKLHLDIKKNIILPIKSLLAFKVLLSLIIFSSFLLSCSKEKTDTSKAVEELILDLKVNNPDCTCEPYINQYVWRSKSVYILAYKGPACDWFPAFYDSNGQEFTLEAGYAYETFLPESSFEKVVWTCN